MSSRLDSTPLYPEERVFIALGARNAQDPCPPEKLTQKLLVAASAQSAAEAFLDDKTGSWRCLCCLSLAEIRPLMGELSEASRAPDRFAQWGRSSNAQAYGPWLAFFEPDGPRPKPGERGARQIVLTTGFDAIVAQCAKDGSRLACALSLPFLEAASERLARARDGQEDSEFIADFNAGLIAPPMPEELDEERELAREARASVVS